MTDYILPLTTKTRSPLTQALTTVEPPGERKTVTTASAYVDANSGGTSGILNYNRYTAALWITKTLITEQIG